MGLFDVVTWNMRGLTLEGDSNPKMELLESLAHYCVDNPDRPVYPVFFLQEAGNLWDVIWKNAFWTMHYTWYFSQPIAALNNRCTTGMLIPKHLDASPAYNYYQLPSLTRNFVMGTISAGGRDIRLASLHAVASRDAAEDAREMLQICCDRDYFVAGGDFNCPPEIMDAEVQFTERLREKGCDYNVWNVSEATHQSPDGSERMLDYICVKGLKVSKRERGFGSVKRHEPMYSDHWPIRYRIEF